MWGEIAAAGGFISLVGIVVRTQQARINKLDDSKVDKVLFEERTGNMIKTLDRIDLRVEKRTGYPVAVWRPEPLLLDP